MTSSDPKFYDLKPDGMPALTYDDVLVVPDASDVEPADVDISVQLEDLALETPILSAAMDTVTDGPAAAAMASLGAMGVIHKNVPPRRQADAVDRARHGADGGPVAAAVGVGDGHRERADALVDAGADAVVIDTAHGHARRVLEVTRRLRSKFPEITLIAGNVATESATEAMIDAGADVVKVGVGPGSICTTRVVAGVGIPQVSAVLECARVAEPRGVPVIADGGIRQPGDIVKAIAAGASSVMLGSLLAGHDESPGDVIERDGDKVKGYRGMGSRAAMEDGSSDRYLKDRDESDPDAPEDPSHSVAEGIEATVPYRGSLEETLRELVGGLRSGMGYAGTPTIRDIRLDARLVRISDAGLRESHVHDVDPTSAND
jgi:IMP dehydrogenase